MHSKLNLAVIFLLLLGLTPAAQAEDNPFVQKLPFQSAVIKYQMQGSEKGTAVLYVDGQRSARHTDSQLSIMGANEKKKTINITTPDKMIEVDLIKGEAKSTGNMSTYMAQEYEKLSAADKALARKNAEKMGAALTRAFMGSEPKTSEGTFKGKPVVITAMAGITTHTWKDTGILLKTQGTMMGFKTDEEATSIETGVPVKAEVLEVPAGIKVRFDQEQDKQMRQMAVTTIAMLKDPQFEAKMKQGLPQGKPGAEESEDLPEEAMQQLMNVGR